MGWFVHVERWGDGFIRDVEKKMQRKNPDRVNDIFYLFYFFFFIKYRKKPDFSIIIEKKQLSYCLGNNSLGLTV